MMEMMAMSLGALQSSSWPAQRTAALYPSTLGSTLRASAEAAPTATALVARRADGGEFRRWSFEQLAQEAELAARALLGRFRPGARVAVWAPNVAEFLLLQLGAGLAGLTLVPVPLGLRHRDLCHLLSQSAASGLFLVPEHRGQNMSRIIHELRPQLPRLREVLELTDWSGFVASSAGLVPLPPVDPRAPAQVMYTSGSTGWPKGAVLHHQGITNSARFLAERMQVTSADVWLNFMPLSYVAGSAIGAMAAIAAGATQVLCDFEPAGVLGLIEAEGCTTALAGSTMFRMLLEELTASGADVSTIKTLAAGGSTIAPELADWAEKAFGARMVVVYGLTEACGIAVSTSANDLDSDRTTTIGTPLPHVEAKVADRGGGQPLPIGEAGELCLRGYQVMDNYLDLPQATAEAIDSAGWLHTGDLADMDARGYLRITGRLKEIINRGGRKIAPSEIEAVLHAHPSVELCAVVGVPDERLGEEIAAFVKRKPGASADDEELACWCRTQLAPFKTPRRWVFLEELPLTSAGKVRKFLLRHQLMG
jgi:fatty-acyl-CoA synthase